MNTKGWGWPINSRKAHYFVNGIALCNCWMFFGELEDDGKTTKDDCKVCTKKLEKIKQKAAQTV